MTKLAIDGGKPVRSVMLPYGRQLIDDDDVRAVINTLRSGWLTTGPRVVEFEDAFSEMTRTKFSVAVSSGTAGLHAAMHAIGIGPGDEVVVPALTFAASANCVLFQGARPIFADVDPRTLTLDPGSVEERITARTRAIISVDFGGLPCDYDRLRDLASRFGLALVSDACHSLGASYKRSPVGSQADLTVFSMHPVKAITTGEGGIVATNNEEFTRRLRQFRNHGINLDFRQREDKNSWYYEIEDIGYNYRLTDIQCALGLSQLKKLRGWIGRRTEIAREYSDFFYSLNLFDLPCDADDRTSAWHLYVIRLHLAKLRVGRGDVFRALRAENIGVNVHYIPVPWHPYYQRLGYKKGCWPVAESAYEECLSLPIWPGMSDADIRDTVNALEKVLKAYLN